MSSTKEKILSRLELSPATRDAICKATCIKWTTAYDALFSLECEGRVKRKKVRKPRGRPGIIWKLKNAN